MNKLSSNKQAFMLNTIYIVFVFSLVYMLALGIGLDLNITLQLLIILLESALVKFFLLYPLVLYGLLVLSFISSILVNHYITPFIPDFLERSYFLISNIIDNLQGKENIATSNLLPFWIILIALVSLFTANILFKAKNIYLLLPLYIGAFIYYWYAFYDQAYLMIAIFLLGFFILMGMNRYNKKELDSQSVSSDDYDRTYNLWIGTAIKYSILIVVLALILPKSNNYIQWPWLQHKIYTKFPIVEELRSYNNFLRSSGHAYLFDFSTTGYQGTTSRLGGPVVLNSRKIMSVYADGPTYLRGNVKKSYTGNSWVNTETFWEDYSLRQDFSKLSLFDKEMYYDESDITIVNHSFASTTLFSPYKPSAVFYNGNHKVKVSSDETMFFDNGVYQRESYLIKIQKPLSYEKIVSLGILNKKDQVKNLDSYLHLPEDKITERTKNLVKEIVKDSKDDFEKAVAIETYLRKNYQYSIDVDEVPNNQEFIDYFLFEGKEGYCTYYATAMAIMLRLEGIPSRYIEGYLAQDLVEPGLYEVKHENAHTWVEAFIEPVGWMTFESTPAYSIEPRFIENSPIIDSSVNPEKVNENQNNVIRDVGEDIFENSTDIEDGKINPSNNTDQTDNATDISKNNIMIFIGILLLFIPVKFIITFILFNYKELNSQKLNNKERIVYLYNQILQLAELLGHPQKHGETHFDYSNRVAHRFSKFDEKGIKEITEIFVKSKYSNSPTFNEDVQSLIEYRKSMENHLRKNWGPLLYFYRKYLGFGYMKN
ncbi:transglutaminase domain-containing protein [Tissierella sp.]|uniref:DUF4129 domain-containing transglutaminase family protein n=1 Tax=Tissierella sp. TaxID=41274 RepID=UPI002859B08C|nr:transglutaminase domain-containing protein [Tissierella sp.]MDR7855974.1 transglutaminase domain-containing protein [Tissierella sp.]